MASDRRSWLDHLSSPPSAWAWPLRLSERALSAPAPSDERRHLVGAFRVPDVSPDRMTLHGFRAMALPILDEVLGFRPDFIEHNSPTRCAIPTDGPTTARRSCPRAPSNDATWAKLPGPARGRWRDRSKADRAVRVSPGVSPATAASCGRARPRTSPEQLRMVVCCRVLSLMVRMAAHDCQEESRMTDECRRD